MGDSVPSLPAGLRVLLGRGARAPRAQTLSAPGADAEAPAVALGENGEAAVLFLEWRGDELRLRAATASAGAWKLLTLDRSTLPIWSPEVAIARGGTAVAAWIDVRGPSRTLWTAVFEPHRGWQHPVALDSGDGLADLTLQSAGPVVAAAWHDSLANENYVRASTYADGSWHPTLLARSLHLLAGIGIDPLDARYVHWRMLRLDRRPLVFRADRRGLAWSPPQLESPR